eukprot:CAMPEP_0176384176 /NCGR_PEP_ID=MMETSP0126-20121128/34108_1 /TAXON_ID=141414 ORGANISM="Strombidinopsis acuminatum, Strain SPMC142" /NCGR_SAMPLE_ID=MMETSP0126 /ASSEMBLY_ACC=CAM_ASM_000229 /LENGTH=57 /DNA_ID=CAMNT_0017749715 /DNA_START=22 /DNA_END=195 /DNA_ORIENTATION=+
MDDFMNDEAIDAFCDGFDQAFDDMSKTTEVKEALLEDYFNPNCPKEQREAMLFNLME